MEGKYFSNNLLDEDFRNKTVFMSRFENVVHTAVNCGCKES